MTLTADDMLTVLEVCVILVGIAVTWIAYRQSATETVRCRPLRAGECSPTPSSANPGPGRET